MKGEYIIYSYYVGSNLYTTALSDDNYDNNNYIILNSELCTDLKHNISRYTGTESETINNNEKYIGDITTDNLWRCSFSNNINLTATKTISSSDNTQNAIIKLYAIKLD